MDEYQARAYEDQFEQDMAGRDEARFSNPGEPRDSNEQSYLDEKVMIALAEIELAREAFEEFKQAWGNVGTAMREIDPGEWNRIDAYPGWEGLRDVGAGRNIEGWMNEAQETLEDLQNAEGPVSNRMDEVDDPDGFEIDRLSH